MSVHPSIPQGERRTRPTRASWIALSTVLTAHLGRARDGLRRTLYTVRPEVSNGERTSRLRHTLDERQLVCGAPCMSVRPQVPRGDRTSRLRHTLDKRQLVCGAPCMSVRPEVSKGERTTQTHPN